MPAITIKPTAHVVDVLGNVIGRDQPILRMEKALEMVSLLGSEVFEDQNIVFFDPFCKAGELLLACAFYSAWAKAKNKPDLLDMRMVFNEIFLSNRYFGLAPDERHHRLSIRTFLGNKNSHDEKFNHIIRDGHYLSEIDGKLNKQKFDKEFISMIEYIKKKTGNKKIIAVGNPPYQENDSGFGGSASAIYNLFAEGLMNEKNISELMLVIPSRWFSAGKGVQEFRNRMINSKEIKSIYHFKQSKEIFPTVDILGGVCFLHWQRNYAGDTTYIEKGVQTVVNFSKYDIVLDDPLGYQIVEKILRIWNGQFVGGIAWSRKPFGIATDYFKKNHKLEIGDKNAVPCYSKRRSILYVNKNHITKNLNKINEYKIVVPAAYAPGSKMGVRRVTLPKHQYFIIPKGYITAETYTVVASFKTELEAENFCNYLKTDFCRYMLGLRKLTQHIPKDRWNWVPFLGADKEYSEAELYKLFKITKEEQAHIKKKVQEWS